MSKKSSGNLCETLFETIGNAILVLQNGQVVDCNAAACTMFDYTKRGLKGKTLLSLSPAAQPDGTSSDEALQEKLDAVAVGQPVQFEWLNWDKKRRKIYTEITLTAAEFEEDTYIQASIQDISKYKQAEDELLDSQRQLADIINFLPEGIFVIDTEGKLIAWNKAMEEMTGIKAKDVLGKGDYEYAIPFYNERRPMLANMAMQPSEEIAKNYPFIERDGDSYVTEVFTPYFMQKGGVTVWAKARPLYDAHGNLVGAIESVRDITERKQAKDELANERNLLRTLIDNIPGSNIFVKDAESRFVLTNQAHLEILGAKSEDEIVGKSDFDLFPKELAQQYFADEQAIVQSGEPVLNKIEPVVDQEGNQKWYLTHKIPLKDEANNVTGLVGLSLDITERRQEEEEFRKSQRQLEENQRLLQLVMDNIPQHIFWKDRNSVFLGANNLFAQVAGFETPDELIGKTDYDLPWSKEEADFFVQTDQRIMAADTPEVGIIEPIQQADGKQAWLETNKVPLHNDKGDVVGILGTFEDITERKMAEQRIRQSEERLRAFIDALPDIAFIQDADGRYLEVFVSKSNTRYANIEETLKGKRVHDVSPSEQADLFVSTIRQALDTGEPQILEYSLKKDVWYEGRVLPIESEEGETERVVWLARDISDRIQMEKALQESEQRLADIIEFLPAPTFAIDNERKVIAWNRACETILGIEAKDILGKGDYEYALPFYGERRPILIDQVFGTTKEILKQYSIQQKGDTLIGEAVVDLQGQSRYFVGTAAPLYDAEDNVVGAIETFRDITEQKQIESAIQDSEQRLSDIINFLPTPTFVIDTEGKVIAWNQAIADVTGVEAEEILGKGNYEYALPFFGKRRPLLIDLIFETDEEIAENYANVRRDGNRLFAENRVFPRGIERIYDLSAAGLYDSQGNLVGAIETFRDITEQKQAERDLRQYQDQLEELVEARTAELEERVRELNALQQLMSREGWEAYKAEQREKVQGYLYDKTSVQPANITDIEQKYSTVSSENKPESVSGNGHSVVKPMAIYGEVIGKLGVYDDPDHPLTPEDQLFLDSVAEQVAEAMERARLLEQSRSALAEVEQSQSQTERLYQANRRLSAAPDLQEAVAAVIEGVSPPDIDRAVLIIFERNSVGEIEFGMVEGNWHNGEGPEPTPVDTRYPISVIQTLKFAMSKEPFFFNDTFNDDRVDSGSMEVFKRQQIRAVASLPLWSGGVQLGTLLVESAVPHIFTQAEIEPFVSLTAQLTVAVENRQLIEQTQTALAEIEATQRRYTVQAWESYRTRVVQQKYEQTREGVAPLGEEIPPEVGEAVARKQVTVKTVPPALITDGEAGNEDSTSLVKAAKSSLAVPLTVRDQVIGVLGLQETDKPREWLPEEIALVQAIAEQMAQAAENIRLLDETQQRAAREQRVNEISDKIQGAQSLEEALQIAVREVGLSLQAPQTSVQLDVD